MKWVAHRGASFEAPENTLAAFELAWALGADAVELDVHATRDGRSVVLHDSDARRTSGIPRVISESCFEDLRALDVGAWKGTAWAGERIPTLADVLDRMPAGRGAMIEIKGGRRAAEAVGKLLASRAARWSDLWLLAFDREPLFQVRERAPGVPALLNIEPPDRGGASNRTDATFLAQLRDEGLQGVSFGDAPDVRAEVVREAHHLGLQVAVWTVDDPRRARELCEAGVDFLMTNDPRRIRP